MIVLAEDKSLFREVTAHRTEKIILEFICIQHSIKKDPFSNTITP